MALADIGEVPKDFYTGVNQREQMKLLDILKGSALIFAACLVFWVFTRSAGGVQGVQGFTANQVSKAAATDASGAALDKVVMEQEVNPPFAIDPISSVDDYEYNAVFRGEGDKAMTKETRDILMSAYPKDWTTQPPSSELFQQGLAAYKESFQNPTQSQQAGSQGSQGSQGSPYKEVDGSNMTPPDSLATEKKEREILATYVPKKPGELTTYDAADAEEIVKRIYSAKGLVADMKKTGDNIFTIMGTRKENEPVAYEPEDIQPTLDGSGNQAPTSSGAVAAAGENTIDVPVNVQQIQSVDPFFQTSAQDKTRGDKWDYTSWTPGLERMFAPTQPQEKWY